MSRLLFHGAKPCADMRYYEMQRAFQLCEALLFGSENIENIFLKRVNTDVEIYLEKKKKKKRAVAARHGGEKKYGGFNDAI